MLVNEWVGFGRTVVWRQATAAIATGIGLVGGWAGTNPDDSLLGGAADNMPEMADRLKTPETSSCRSANRSSVRSLSAQTVA